MSVNEKLAAKGRAVPLTALRDQTNYTDEMRLKRGPEVAERGWAEKHDRSFIETKTLLESERAAQLESRSESQAATATEQDAVDNGKQVKRTLVTAAKDLDADGELPFDLAEFNAGGTIGRNTAKLVSYFADVLPKVQSIDALLTPYFGGTSAYEKVKSAKDQLDLAQGRQEVALASLPQETLEFYEAKGRMLSLIEKFNRLGTIRYDGDAAKRALFNKDLILRARRGAAAKDDGEVEELQTKTA